MLGYWSVGSVSKTLLILEQAYAANPNRTDVLLLIGAIYYQKKNYEQCIAFNDRCILLDPTMAEAHANLANALQQLGNYDMAIIYYQVCDVDHYNTVVNEQQSDTSISLSCASSSITLVALETLCDFVDLLVPVIHSLGFCTEQQICHQSPHCFANCMS